MISGLTTYNVYCLSS